MQGGLHIDMFTVQKSEITGKSGLISLSTTVFSGQVKWNRRMLVFLNIREAWKL
ncbi:MAG TPA: hypothetical protein PKK94_05235 [Leptospiraceae bacterium]|nr:hypothetical protein [Leptospiraceae bacterium]